MTESSQLSESLLSKVRRLLAKAENPACTPEEAAAYNDKAAELIAKYGVDRAMLAASDPASDVVGDRTILVEPPYALDKNGLLATIAAALRCRSIRRKVWRDGAYAYRLHLFGFASDLERVELLFTSLLVQASFGLANAEPPSWSSESTVAFRRTWLVGFAAEVGRRLRAAEQRAATTHQGAADEDGPSVALVLVGRKDRVDRAIDEAYPNLKKARTRSLSGSGYAHGRAAGARADLGGTRLGSASRARIGGAS